MTRIDKNSDTVLLMMIDMRKIHKEYFNPANKADSQYVKICTYALELEEDFCISNEKKKQTITFLQEQAKKLEQ